MPKKARTGSERAPTDASVPTPAEVAALLEACSVTAATGIRNRALFAFLADTGARINEALNVKGLDLDLTASPAVARLRVTKGGKPRAVTLHPHTVAAVARWMDRRKARGINGTAPVFCTLKGTPLWATYVRTALERTAAKAGIKRRMHPHAFRHFMAVQAVQAEVPLPAIQERLGHANLSTTEAYLRRIAPGTLDAVYRAKAWTDAPPWGVAVSTPADATPTPKPRRTESAPRRQERTPAVGDSVARIPLKRSEAGRKGAEARKAKRMRGILSERELQAARDAGRKVIETAHGWILAENPGE